MQTVLTPTQKKVNPLFLRIFSVVLALQLFSRFISPDAELLGMVTKPLLMPVLFLHFWQNRNVEDKRLNLWVFFALFFSFSGDVWLMFEGSTFFLLGLGSFLLAHVFYIVIFSSVSSREGESSFLKANPQWYFPFLHYVGLLFYLIYPGLGSMLIPVIIYSSVICIMALVALNRKGRVGQRSFVMVLVGAILFVLSDSLIALGKFDADFASAPLMSFWIMLTYGVAQLLIVQGLISQSKDEG